jgi:energy-converting hydrogenase B subunit Q
LYDACTMSSHAVVVSAVDRTGLLHQLTEVFANHGANITAVDIHPGTGQSKIDFEFTIDEAEAAATLVELGSVPGVTAVEQLPPFDKIYGKRIVVMGGGAQVGFVAMGAISEADRHNIRGERISIDTIPLVGEKELAAAVRAAVRVPRIKLLVLAGSIMGGEITDAVEEVQKSGLPVISLNMVGSVAEAADLVVSDPVQAGVMAVMAVADTAKFDLMRQRKRRY